VKSTVYLVATKEGVDRLTKRHPELGRHEVALKLEVEIPDDCFRAPVIEGVLRVEREDLINVAAAVNYGNRNRRLQLDEEPVDD
jgi:hypothetical protein